MVRSEWLCCTLRARVWTNSHVPVTVPGTRRGGHGHGRTRGEDRGTSGGHNAPVGIAVSQIISTAGLILALAVHPNGSHSIDVNTVGWILFVLGEGGPLLDPLLWSEWGLGYMRRTAVADRGASYLESLPVWLDNGDRNPFCAAEAKLARTLRIRTCPSTCASTQTPARN
jgi:hypothetical protein